MSGLPWVQLATGIPRNYKILELVGRKQFQAVTCYMFSLAYSGEQGTDGYIPLAALPYIHANQAIATQLVNVHLWIPTMGGWDINDWSEHQRSTDETQKRKDKAKAAAEARWNKARERQSRNGLREVQ